MIGKHSINNIKMSDELVQKASTIQSSKIVKPIFENLCMYSLEKEIIYEFNIKHREDPANYSSREGKELTAAILSHWANNE